MEKKTKHRDKVDKPRDSSIFTLKRHEVHTKLQNLTNSLAKWHEAKLLIRISHL